MVAAIRTAGLAKSFGATAALRPLDLEVAEGEVLGYLGPNGAGKTTIRCLLARRRAGAPGGVGTRNSVPLNRYRQAAASHKIFTLTEESVPCLDGQIERTTAFERDLTLARRRI